MANEDTDSQGCHINEEILFRIPSTAECVVEIGVKNNELERAYSRINPKAKYIRVESSNNCKNLQARKKGEGNSNFAKKEGDEKNKRLKIDCLVVENPLGGMQEINRLINFYTPNLREDAKIIISVENLSYWKRITNLLTGSKHKSPNGSALTREELIELIKNCGLRLFEIISKNDSNEEIEALHSYISKYMESIHKEYNRESGNIQTKNYIAICSPLKEHRLHIGGLMLQPQAGMNDVRMIQPLRNMASITGIHLQLSSNGLSLLPKSYNVPKVMVWQRQLLTYEESLERIKQVVMAGYVLISEFDDDPDHWPKIKEQKYLNFSGVHAVQTSTKSLANKLKNYNDEIAVFENCIDIIPEVDQDKWSYLGVNKRIRVFFGALNRENEWKDWIEEINKVILECQDLIEFEVIHDKQFFDALQTEQKRFTPTCNYKTYIERLKGSHISLLPLNYTEFNAKKSDLKLVESAGCNTASMASSTVYGETISDNNIGRIINKTGEVYDVLKTWIRNPIEAKKIADNGRLWCVNNRLQSAQSNQRLEWYSSLWERREELNLKLKARVPELFN